MERRSDKHAGRLDDQMKDESTEVRAEEDREKEGPGEGEPVPDARLSGDRDLTPAGTLSPDEAEERAELARHIQGVAFPGDREALLASAREMHAPDGVLSRLDRLPQGTTFENVQQVWEALGGSREEAPGGHSG